MTDSPRPTPAPRPKPPPALPSKNKGRNSGSSGFELTHVSPSTVIYNKHEQVVLVFNQSLPSNVEFTICFTGLKTEKVSKVQGNRVADNVLAFVAPEHFPPEETKLTVHHGSMASKLCSFAHSFTFKSPLQTIREHLQMVSDPVEFMCAAFHLRRKDSISLDIELEKNFQRKLPPNFELLCEDGRERVEPVESPNADPTLLHFAARYNLLRLSVALLKCPGWQKALNTQNCDQLTPSDIAYDCGHEELAGALADSQQNPNQVEEVYMEMKAPLYDSYRKEEQEIYMAMGNAEEEDVIYEQMSCNDEEETFYQNDDELFQGGKEAFLKNLSPEHREGDPPADGRSLFSVSSASSTSSAESNNSVDAGYASSPYRQQMPLPRHTYKGRASLPEIPVASRSATLPPKSLSMKDKLCKAKSLDRRGDLKTPADIKPGQSDTMISRINLGCSLWSINRVQNNIFQENQIKAAKMMKLTIVIIAMMLVFCTAHIRIGREPDRPPKRYETSERLETLIRQLGCSEDVWPVVKHLLSCIGK
eukprot:gene12689-13992_t